MVGKALLNSKIDEVCFIGEPMVKTTAEMFRASGKPFTLAVNIDEVRAFVAASQPGDTVLIKGSRALELERALETLQ
jgi:UDP-N-acetylmuramoyl-tripeptide--D-alanyl-D-alanine ligase